MHAVSLSASPFFAALSSSQMTDLAHICIPPFGVVSPVIYDM